MAITEEEIKAALTGEDHSVEDVFVMGGLPMYLGEVGDEKVPMAIVIEDDALAAECVKYLMSRGAREFRTWEELNKWKDGEG